MASKSLPSLLAFLCGSTVGFFLCYQLLHIFLEKPAEIQPYILHNDPHARHSEDAGHGHLEGQMDFNADTSQHRDEDKHMAEELYHKVRVLCWVMTGPQNLEKKARHVKATWGRRCNKILFMSSEENKDFPTVGLDTREGRDQLYWKTIRAFHYVHEHHLDEADWFMKADDDTYVVLDNLRWLLSRHDPAAPVYFGRRFKPYVKQGYMSGGAGYVLSKEALRRFVRAFQTNKCSHSSSVEDLALGKCMEAIGVEAGDSRDPSGKETFHPFVPEHHLIKGYLPKTFWYWNYNYYPPVEIPARVPWGVSQADERGQQKGRAPSRSWEAGQGGALLSRRGPCGASAPQQQAVRVVQGQAWQECFSNGRAAFCRKQGQRLGSLPDCWHRDSWQTDGRVDGEMKDSSSPD
ncbi:glycoprotein-N-acetylgalactosamine 3-beta-galactosyltransferase 1 isoform X2 [Dromiciops gliroides]|uniref:glycoprotein-N-acetylgalactosamine 3-beta-galactosyltransferase 1 isoform X2 n=1 Tax=Dromiciops gliroides TaxID=33562 RepID=UPI001CC701FD|nr:glycoprotein-N-acetylgalactosamine 3-beta-galactosyltransferase 1 isoform X2 [Dromiciops gliroides]